MKMILGDFIQLPLNHLIDLVSLALLSHVGTALGQVKMNPQQISVIHGAGFPFSLTALVKEKLLPMTCVFVRLPERAYSFLQNMYTTQSWASHMS